MGPPGPGLRVHGPCDSEGLGGPGEDGLGVIHSEGARVPGPQVTVASDLEEELHWARLGLQLEVDSDSPSRTVTVPATATARPSDSDPERPKPPNRAWAP